MSILSLCQNRTSEICYWQMKMLSYRSSVTLIHIYVLGRRLLSNAIYSVFSLYIFIYWYASSMGMKHFCNTSSQDDCVYYVTPKWAFKSRPDFIESVVCNPKSWCFQCVFHGKAGIKVTCFSLVLFQVKTGNYEVIRKLVLRQDWELQLPNKIRSSLHAGIRRRLPHSHPLCGLMKIQESYAAWATTWNMTRGLWKHSLTRL